MPLKTFFLSALIVTAAALPTAAFAQIEQEASLTAEDDDAVKDDSKWGLHLGTAFVLQPEFIGSDDTEFRIFPFLQASYDFDDKNKIYFRGLQGGYEHDLNDTWHLGVELTARNNRQVSDDARLNGMTDIDHAFELGPWAQWRHEDFRLKGTFRFDISGEHDGFAVELLAKQKIRIKPGVFFNGYAETTWADNNFMDHYFTVLPGQAIAGRPAYNASSGFYQSAVGANFNYGLRKDLFLRVDGKVQFLHDEANDSALVYQSTNFLGFVGIGYAF